MARPMWAKQVLTELAWVAQRRRDDQNKMHEYMQLTQGTRSHIKTLMQ